MNPQVAAAKAIATIAHKGQTDKLGADYIGHPARVAKMLVDKNAEPAAIAAAWLHDVIEDCADIFHGEPRFGITAEDLHNAGIDKEVVDAVKLLTRPKGPQSDSYYEAIRENPIALAVKLADIDDNTDFERTARLDPATRKRLADKYEHALAILNRA